MKLLRKADFFSNNIPIFYQKDDKYNTNFGCCVSLLISVLGIICFQFFSRNLFLKINPKTIQYSYFSTDLHHLSIKNSSIFFAISLWNLKLNHEFINESVFTIDAYVLTKNTSVKLKDQMTRTPIKLEICTPEHIPKTQIAQEYFKNKPLHLMYCLQKDFYERLSVYGVMDDNFFQSIIINLKRCKNSTKCASAQEMDDLFRISYIYFYYIENAIDPTNYQNPQIFYPKLLNSFFSANDLKKIFVNLEFIELITDKGLIMKEEIYEKFGTFGHIEENIHNYDPNKDNYFGQIYLRYSKNRRKIKREYDKIPKVLAEVGGMLNVIIIVINFLLKPFTDILFLVEMVNKYFYFRINEEDKKKIYKKVNTNRRNGKEDSCDGKINKIEIADYPFSMIVNYSKKFLFKIRTSLCKMLYIIYFQRKFKKKKDQILNLTQINYFSNCDIQKILKTIFEVKLIKKLVFDENQRKLFKFIPKFIVSYPNDTFSKKTNNLEHLIQNLQNKRKKSEIDKKLLQAFTNEILN